MKYFKLLPNTKFEYDNKGGCIINLIENIRINLDYEQTVNLVHLIENSFESINNLKEDSKALILRIMDQGMGYIYDKNIYYEEHLDNRGQEIRGLAESIPLFKKIYIQSSNTCNGTCKFCINKNSIIYNGCDSCIMWKNKMDENNIILDLNEMKEIAIRISKFFVNTIIFSGGNPFLNWERVKLLIQLIREKSLNKIEIQIHTNGSGLNDDIIYFCYENCIELIFTILGYDELSYKDITGCDSLYNDIKHAIGICNMNNIRYKINALGVSNNINRIIEFIKNLGGYVSSVAEIYDEGLIFESVDSYKIRMEKTPKNIRRNEKYNSCLFEKFALNLYGDIQPCPMISEKLANLVKDEIEEPFQNMRIDKYWRMTKRQVRSCSGCPYQYSCEDCTAVELEINSGKVLGRAICERIDI